MYTIEKVLAMAKEAETKPPAKRPHGRPRKRKNALDSLTRSWPYLKHGLAVQLSVTLLTMSFTMSCESDSFLTKLVAATRWMRVVVRLRAMAFPSLAGKLRVKLDAVCFLKHCSRLKGCIVDLRLGG